MNARALGVVLSICIASSILVAYPRLTGIERQGESESSSHTSWIEEVDELAEKPDVTRERAELIASDLLTFPSVPEARLMKDRDLGKLYWEVSVKSEGVWAEIDAKTGNPIRVSDPRGLRFADSSDWEVLARAVVERLGQKSPPLKPQRNQIGQWTELYWDLEFRGIPVLGGRISVVIDPEAGAPIMAGSTFVRISDDNIEPALSEEQAVSLGVEEIKAKGWSTIFAKVGGANLVFARPESTDKFGSQHRLAWAVYLSDPSGTLGMGRVLLDAFSGGVIGVSCTR
jgi:hypothetical protein